jgi:hypothetical protein
MRIHPAWSTYRKPLVEWNDCPPCTVKRFSVHETSSIPVDAFE